MASLARIPVLGGFLRSLSAERPGLTIEVVLARAWDSRPAVRVTVANLAGADRFLESVGMVFVDGSAFGDWVGADLPTGGEPHVSWYRLADLEARLGRPDPLGGLEEVFAAATVGTQKVRVDRRRLRAELRLLQEAAAAPSSGEGPASV